MRALIFAFLLIANLFFAKAAFSYSKITLVETADERGNKFERKNSHKRPQIVEDDFGLSDEERKKLFADQKRNKEKRRQRKKNVSDVDSSGNSGASNSNYIPDRRMRLPQGNVINNKRLRNMTPEQRRAFLQKIKEKRLNREKRKANTGRNSVNGNSSGRNVKYDDQMQDGADFNGARPHNRLSVQPASENLGGDSGSNYRPKRRSNAPKGFKKPKSF